MISPPPPFSLIALHVRRRDKRKAAKANSRHHRSFGFFFLQHNIAACETLLRRDSLQAYAVKRTPAVRVQTPLLPRLPAPGVPERTQRVIVF